MLRSSFRRFALLFVSLLAVSFARGALTAPLHFDAGPATSASPLPGVTRLAPGDRYDPARGWGWTAAPTDTFVHRQFANLRPAALTEGVAGSDCTLRLDLAPGRWAVLLSLDDGYADAAAVSATVNGQPVELRPRPYGQDAEPPAPPVDLLQLAQFVVTVPADAPTLLRLHSPHTVRLLAVRVAPLDWPDTPRTRWLLDQLRASGAHDSRAPLEALRVQLAAAAADPALAGFCAYWLTQLELLATAESWHARGGWDWVSAATRSSMFTRYRHALACLDPLLSLPAETHATLLGDRARWLRARLLYWLWREQEFPEDRAVFDADIALLRQAHPADSLVAMYAGEQIPTAPATALPTPLPDAPAWSTAQLEALARLRDLARYWITERQIPNGEFGGKLDDDVELLRWWSPLLFTGDTLALDGYLRLGEGVWQSPRLHLGYSRAPRDVEHSSEFISDTVPLLALATGSAAWTDRLAFSHRHMRDLWTGRDAHGDLRFKSAWLGATEILTEPPRNRDLAMNTRAAKAVRYYAWLTRDPAAVALLHDWSLAWAKSASTTAKSKPRGLFPASVRFPDALPNGDETSWHHANMFWDYFEWLGQGDLYDQLLFSWLTAPDDRLLAPMRDTLAFLAAQPPAAPGAPPPPPGSPAWAASLLLNEPTFWAAVVHWRTETGEASHDAFLLRHAPPYLRYRLTGDPAPLATGLTDTLLAVLRYNRPLLTSEVLFTDRVYVSRDTGPIDGTDLLTAMLTGCHAADGVSPYFHVAWENVPATFTALVQTTGSDRFAADLYLHQTASAPVTARLLRLSPGGYRLTLTAADGRILTDRIETITTAQHRATVDLPGATLATLRLTRQP